MSVLNGGKSGGIMFGVLGFEGADSIESSSSGMLSMFTSPRATWSACLLLRWDSNADFTLNSAGQNGQRLLITWLCARN